MNDVFLSDNVEDEASYLSYAKETSPNSENSEEAKEINDVLRNVNDVGEYSKWEGKIIKISPKNILISVVNLDKVFLAKEVLMKKKYFEDILGAKIKQSDVGASFSWSFSIKNEEIQDQQLVIYNKSRRLGKDEKEQIKKEVLELSEVLDE